MRAPVRRSAAWWVKPSPPPLHPLQLYIYCVCCCCCCCCCVFPLNIYPGCSGQLMLSFAKKPYREGDLHVSMQASVGLHSLWRPAGRRRRLEHACGGGDKGA